MTSGILAWAAAGGQKRRSGFAAKDSTFIQLGTAVCAGPVGIRGAEEGILLPPESKVWPGTGRTHMCVVKGRRRSGAGRTEPSVGEARAAGGERACREVGGGPGEWCHEGQWWRACLLGLGLGRSRWWF